jgi:lipopolysaccharide heptosyltransferase II
VLAVRLDGAGDVLMTGPAIAALRRGAASRQVTLLASSAGAQAAGLIADIDEVIEYTAPWMKVARSSSAAADTRFIESLRDRFDAAVIFTVYSQSALPAALMCMLAGIPLRAAHCRENPYGLLTRWLREPEPEELVRHEVDRQLALAAAVGAGESPMPFRLSVPAAAARRALEVLARVNLRDDERWALLHPGASAPSRRYSPHRWAAVVRALTLEHGWRVLLTGGSGDAELIEEIGEASGVRPARVLGLSFAELAALIEAAPMLLAVNSAAAHVASAVGTPVIDVYALTNPQHGPWNGTPHRVLSHDVPCRNCYRSECPLLHHDCLRLVEPGEVVRAALELRAALGR